MNIFSLYPNNTEPITKTLNQLLKEEPEIEKNKISINWVPPSVCLDSLLYLSLFWKEYRLKQVIVICHCVCPKIVIIFRCCKIIYLLIYWYFLNCFFHFLIWYFFLKFVILKMLLLVCLENASQFSLARIYCLCPFSRGFCPKNNLLMVLIMNAFIHM